MPDAVPLRPGPFDDLVRASRAAEGRIALAPGGPADPDAWTLAVALAMTIPDLQIVFGVPRGWQHPGVMALMAATLDSVSGGRLVLEVEDDEEREIIDRLLRGEPALNGAVVGLRPARSPVA